jgi:hypothetical protein
MLLSLLLQLTRAVTPLRRRRRYAAVGGLAVVLAVARLVFGLAADPTFRSWVGLGLPTCDAAEISTPAAHEGTCARGQGPFGGGTVYNVVDAGHVLHMPGYDVRLLATRLIPTRVTNPQTWPSAYPGGRGMVVSFELSIANRGGAPLRFEGEGRDADLLIDDPDGSGSVSFPDLPNASGGPGPSLVESGAILPRDAAIRWVSFVAPIWVGSLLHQRAADLELYRPGDARHAYVGHNRLWKWANAAGQAALGLTPVSSPPA